MKSAWAILLIAALVLVQGHASAVDVTDFAVYANGKVKVGDTVYGNVGSYGSDVQLQGRATVFGSAVAGGGIGVSSRSVLYGDATAGGDIKVKGIGRVKGNVTPWAPPGVLDPLLAGGLMPIGNFNSGGQSYKGKQNMLNLAPGSYGDVKVSGGKGGGEFVLNSGDYYFDSLSLKRTTVYLDLSDGAINIYVQDKFQLSRTGVEVGGLAPAAFVMDGAGSYDEGAAELVYLETHGKAKLSGSDWLGTVFAPYADLAINNTSIIGAVYGGGDVKLKGRASNVIYAPLLTDGMIDPAESPDDPNDPNPPDPQIAAAPEPGTLALLGTGLMALLAQGFSRRKRKRSA